jgi:hypothetical protein
MDTEYILALVGVILALFAFYGLSAYKRAVERKKEEKFLATRSKSPADAPPYFLVAYEVLFLLGGAPKLFRVYGDTDALLFIKAGPYHPAMADSIKQMRGKSGEKVGEAAGRAIALGARAGGEIGAVAGAVAAGLDWLTLKSLNPEVAQRARVLDAMTLDDLRQAAASEKHCFRVAQGNVSKVRLRPVSRGFFSLDEPDLAGYLSFVHRPTGKWLLKLVSHADARDAVREFRRVLPADQIEVRFSF